MKKITLFLSLFVLCFQSFAQDATFSNRESPASANINQRITIRTDLINIGTARTPSFRMYYYLNSTPNLNGNPIPLNVISNVDGSFIPGSNFDVVRAMNPAGSPAADDDENHHPHIPNNLVTGTYYIVWHLDINDQNTSNNIRTRSIFINGITPNPDLVVVNPSVPSGTLDVGASITARANVRNQGSQNAGSSTLEYWISSNNTIGAGDVRLATDPVQSLNINQTSTQESATFNLPADRSGTQYIIFRADGTNAITETNENNNTTAVQINIRTSPGVIDIDRIVVRDEASTVIYDSNSSTTIPTLFRNRFYDFSVTLRNIGGQSRRPQFSHFYSRNNSLDLFNDCDVQSFGRGDAIPPNGTDVESYSVFIDSNRLCGNNTGGFFFFFADNDLNGNILSDGFQFNLSNPPGICCGGGIIFPNPSPIGVFFLEQENSNTTALKANIGPSTSVAREIIVYNMSGQVVHSQKLATKGTVSIDLSKQPNGTYILKEIRGSETFTKMIIKN
ncbi:CARDB domain-containing protein [Spongiimicrobium salis]|uniref:CARDB domain-containing protein n=1 Tax=Spongiimicrobium salis TaxID=1667022 RepID=UPI00374D13A5